MNKLVKGSIMNPTMMGWTLTVCLHTKLICCSKPVDYLLLYDLCVVDIKVYKYICLTGTSCLTAFLYSTLLDKMIGYNPEKQAIDHG